MILISFSNVAKDIGSSDRFPMKSHPSITKIHEHSTQVSSESFHFQHVNPDTVAKSISNLHMKKATGVDGISPRFLKSCSSSISQPLADLINYGLDTHSFKTGTGNSNL